MSSDIYTKMAGHLPNKIAVGGALITMVEPDVGFEHAYNRWYEDDHFYSGAMVGPWMFAGRRWVATRDLLSLRFPVDSPIAQPVTAGCYISTYLVLEGHLQDHRHWSRPAMREYLRPAGRGFENRQHIYTAFSTYDFGVIRYGERFLQPHHVLDHPFSGLVVEVIELDQGGSRAEVLRKLQSDVLPDAVKDTPIAATLAFTPGEGHGAPGAGVNLTLLSFVQSDPRSCWSLFREHEALYSEIGGRLVFAAPFIPTVPGTDIYVDELR
jgi:hypothetical protein